jgi:ferric-dicitrate binding protein FerR (iron transport regulator)
LKTIKVVEFEELDSADPFKVQATVWFEDGSVEVLSTAEELDRLRRALQVQVHRTKNHC